MSKDLDIIEQLETKIGKKIMQSSINDLLTPSTKYTIDENKNIIGLNLYKSEISEIYFLKSLVNLTHLSLVRNRISDISNLKNFPNLNRLYLGNNQISDISILKNLKALTHLNLFENRITDISALENLTNLTRLYLGRNRISDISFLKNLNVLTHLNLLDNRITDISVLGNLTNLIQLDLRNNKISKLPDNITDWKMDIGLQPSYLDDEGIFLERNPLDKPPLEIVRQGREAIRAYFKSLEKEKKALNEVKVLLVGDGGAGKTSLVKQLLWKKFDKNESQTHGINIENWEVKSGKDKIKVRLWDFGGQEIMHATHQFFLSKRSFYVLVLDGRRDEKTEYWLNHIKSFGGDSPVLAVINKIDLNPGFDVNRHFLEKKYKNIKGFFRLSCATGEGIEDFSKRLVQELAKVDLLQTSWGQSWFNVKTYLETMSEDFISYDKYIALCEKENIREKISQDTLVDYLNDLGVILHFKDFKLRETHVLDPEWVTTAVYKIINSKKIVGSRGLLKLTFLDDILKKSKKDDYHYPRNKYKFIIDLMKKFELCYKVDDETILIPDLLEIQEPSFDFDYDKSLKFIVEYDFLPKSVMPRFIVRMHEDIKQELRWRTGVVLEDKVFQSIAVIKVDNEANRIYIDVNGKQKRDYFAAVLLTLRHINQSFEKLETTELVPMPDEPEITVDYEHLIRLEEEGIEYYLPGKSKNKYRVKDLLGTIAAERITEKEILLLLRKIKADTDTFETLLKKANDTIMLQPNILGFGINLNKLIEKVIPHKRNKGKS